MRLVLLGPPGAGKGTQAQFIAAAYAIPAISTGDIFRANASAGTPLGLKARAFMDAGDLVPDEVTIAMVEDRLAQDDAADGFLLDGFPRTVGQADVLAAWLKQQGRAVDAVLELSLADDEVVRRLSGRRTCRACGRNAHVISSPPQRDGVCDHCGGELFQRDDDKPETILRRLDVYAQQTAPLVGYYAERKLLHTIDASGTVAEVTERAVQVLKEEG